MGKIIEADDADPCIFTRDLDAPFKIIRKYAGIMAARGFGANGRGGVREPSRRPQARDILTILEKTAISVETSSISGRGRKSRSPNAI